MWHVSIKNNLSSSTIASNFFLSSTVVDTEPTHLNKSPMTPAYSEQSSGDEEKEGE